MRNRSGYIYIVRAGGHCKIGIAKDVSTRLKQLPKLPFELELLHTIKTNDMNRLEAELHRRYAEQRCNGEWFTLSDEHLYELELINEINYGRVVYSVETVIDAKRLKLRRGQVTLVSPEDHDILQEHVWSWSDQLGVVRYDADRYSPTAQHTPHVLMARLITHASEEELVIHVDGDKLNNTRENLLLLTKPQYTQYFRRASGSSRYLGVAWVEVEGLYRAQIARQQIGRFDEEEEGARTYDERALELYGPQAQLNFPDEHPTWRVCRECHRAYSGRRCLRC